MGMKDLPIGAKVIDSENDSLYVIDIDNVTEISGEDKCIGKIGRPPAMTHVVTGPGRLSLKMKINGTLCDEKFGTTGSYLTLTMPAANWNQLELLSENTLTFELSSTEGASSIRTYTFTKTVWFPEKGDTLKEIVTKGLSQVNDTLDSQKIRISNKLTDCNIDHDDNVTLKELVDVVEEKLGEPTPYPIYTVVIDLDDPNPSTRCTYADDAKDMIPLNFTTPSENDWMNKFPFNAIRPCVFDNGSYTPNKMPKAYVKTNNYRQWLDATTAITSTDDVMVEFPRFYHKVNKKGRKLYISICEIQATKEFVNYAHLKPDGTHASKIYLGAYLGYVASSKIYSQYSKPPIIEITKANARTYSKARGAQLITYHMWSMIQLLYVIAFKTTSGYSFAKGNVSSGSLKNTGTNDTKGLYFQNDPENYGKQQMKLFGMEDVWGNLQYHVDGIVGRYKRVYLAYTNFASNPNSNYTDVGPCYPDLGASFGTVKDVVGSNELPFFPCEYIDENISSDYFCDKTGCQTSAYGYHVGNHFNGDNQKRRGSIFSESYDTDGSSVFGVRLAFVPNY